MGERTPGRSIGQWDRYWSFGSLHSFSQVSGGNYEGAIADFWRQRFSDLAAGAHVLDIATGNGAVPLLALEAADRAGIAIRVDGVDLAQIDPAARVQDPGPREALGRVRFHSRTPAESLPFPEASIDLVCSQYGLEYSDLPAAVAEIARVSAPGAGVALILHHAESALLHSAGMEFEQLSFVLDEARLWLHARNLLRAMAESGNRRKSKVEKKRIALDDALQRIHRAARNTSSPRMLLGPTNYIHEILAGVGRESWSRLLELLEESRQRMLANRQRLADMQEAARDAGDMEALADLFREQGFAIDRVEVLTEHDGTLLGWRFEAYRA
jgi:ubiquinone/menaquinone biosynthesis C-methylase UbiE